MTDKERIAELEEALARANELLSQQQDLYERQLEELASAIENQGHRMLDSLAVAAELVV